MGEVSPLETWWITEQRAGGEQANHEVGRGACSSTKTHLSGENILEREGGNWSGAPSLRVARREAAQQLDAMKHAVNQSFGFQEQWV